MKIRYEVWVAGLLLCVLAAAAQTSTAAMEYLKQGSQFYIARDYKQAIDPYSKALELEKKQSTLPKPLWYVLVDNLGIAYGITGDLKKAKETFEYGLSQDSKYPLFYYNLACTYAEMGDLDYSIENLKHAYDFKANVLPGEAVPDPSKDNSFQRFMRNERFLAALKDLK